MLEVWISLRRRIIYLRLYSRDAPQESLMLRLLFFLSAQAISRHERPRVYFRTLHFVCCFFILIYYICGCRTIYRGVDVSNLTRMQIVIIIIVFEVSSQYYIFKCNTTSPLVIL